MESGKALKRFKDKCGRKSQYNSKEEAELELEKIKNTDNYKHQRILFPNQLWQTYHCSICSKFHIGRTRKNGNLYAGDSRKIMPEKMIRKLMTIPPLHFCRYCSSGPLIKNQNYNIPAKYFLTYDHIIPSSKGGSNKKENLVPCCHDCNNLKSDYTLSEWLIVLEEKLKTNPQNKERLEIIISHLYVLLNSYFV